MASALNERVWHRRAEPDQIDAGLRDLWSEIGREAPVSRALLSTLVVFRSAKADEQVDLEAPFAAAPLEEVLRRHPARVIVLHHSPDGPRGCSPVASAIRIVTFGAGTVRYGIEQLTIRSMCADASLPSIVRRLAVGGMPTCVWWTDDLSRVHPIVPIATLGRLLLYDSHQWRDVHAGVATLGALLREPHAPHLADVNWRRTRTLRRGLTQAFAPALCERHQPGAVRATVRHRPGESSMAWLVAGWLASRLANAETPWPVTVEEMRHGSDVLTVTLDAEDAPDLVATMNGHRVLVKYREGRAAPLVLMVPRETDADAIAGELHAIGGDVCLHDTITTLAAQFAGPR